MLWTVPADPPPCNIAAEKARKCCCCHALPYENTKLLRPQLHRSSEIHGDLIEWIDEVFEDFYRSYRVVLTCHLALDRQESTSSESRSRTLCRISMCTDIRRPMALRQLAFLSLPQHRHNAPRVLRCGM